MKLKVIEFRRAWIGEGVSALVVGLSQACVEGDPEVKILMRLRLPTGANRAAARDLALKYLDIA